jgi:hypothetical protein
MAIRNARFTVEREVSTVVNKAIPIIVWSIPKTIGLALLIILTVILWTVPDPIGKAANLWHLFRDG